MAKEQKERRDISNEYKWDLTTIYKDDNIWHKEYKRLKKEISKLAKYNGILMDSANNLYEFLELNTTISIDLEKLYIYAHHSSDVDTRDTKNQELSELANNILDIYKEAVVFLKPTILKYEYLDIEKFYKDEPKLLEYRFLLEQLFRYKEHSLNQDEENMLVLLNSAISAPSEIYSKLMLSDMKFGIITDENGDEVELTESNYPEFLRSKNGKVRSDAFNTLYDSYISHKNTLAKTYSSQVQLENNIAKIYKFDSALEQSLFEDNIDVSVYTNLIDTVHEGLKYIHEYYKLRKDVLKLDTQHIYDTYLNLVKGEEKKYSFEEARELVTDALKVFGEDYIEIVNKAFDEKWIDVYNNVGKLTGGYCGGCYATKPFILLNYEGRIRDIETLIHELGHAVHGYLTRSSNPHQYGYYSIFVAEVASTVNELILNQYMLKHAKTKEEKLDVLNKQLDMYKGTIYRQTMFAEFEKIAHEEASKGEILTCDFVSNIYIDLVKKYFGDSVYIDDKIRYEWIRISHFYNNFYTYKYATGISAASHIVLKILSGEEGALENYKKFLSSGGSMYPLDELKIAGIDMSNPVVVESAIEMFNNTLQEFKNLIDS